MTPHLKTFDFLSNTLRLKEIFFVLARRGFGEVLEVLNLPRSWGVEAPSDDAGSQTIWQRIRLTLEDLGPTFVKFGQVLSSRPDLLPEPLITELKLLRSKVRETPFSQMLPILEGELKATLSDLFSEFDTQAFACGSIGQVYRARLLEDGMSVAVKIQRPDIRQAIRSDVSLLDWLARQIDERVPELQGYDLPSIVEATGEGILQELDFSIEATNALVFNQGNPYPQEVFAPRVYPNLITPRVTVAQWIDGKHPGEFEVSPEEGRRLAEAGGRSVFTQIFLTGFFHGDPHGGNILITADGRACLMDWGLAGQLTREMRYFLADLFAAISRMDAEKVARIATLMAESKKRVDRIKLEKDISLVLRRHRSRIEADEVIGGIVIDMLYAFGINGIRLARDYSLLARALISIEEVGRTLDPDFDIGKTATPILRQLAYERWSPESVFRQTIWNVLNNLHRIRELPQDLQRFFRHLEDGEIRINMRHMGIEEAGEAFTSGVNRLALALITASLVVGSSLIMASQVDKVTAIGKLFVFPTIIATAGYFLSVLCAVWIILDILRPKKRF